MKLFTALTVALLLPALVAARSSDSSAAMKAAGPGKYLLVLGDSESTGYHFVGFSTYAGGWNCELKSQIASGRMGWTCLLRSYMRKLVPGLQLENLALNGEDTCSFIAIHLCDGSTNGRSGYPNYNTAKISQLDFALKFLEAHPGEVNPIFFLIGGNDLASSDPYASILTRIRSNRDLILSKLRQAAPHADIILPDYPDPSPSELKLGGFISDLDSMINTEAQKYNAFRVSLAIPTEYWHYSFSDTQNGHPSDLGQKQIAELLWANYRDFMHGRQPIPLNVKPTGDHLPAGKTATFVYATAPAARLTLKLSYTGGHKSWSAHANTSGRWKASWSTAGHKGHIGVLACASKGGSNYCVDEYFVVT